MVMFEKTEVPSCADGQIIDSCQVFGQIRFQQLRVRCEMANGFPGFVVDAHIVLAIAWQYEMQRVETRVGKN